MVAATILAAIVLPLIVGEISRQNTALRPLPTFANPDDTAGTGSEVTDPLTGSTIDRPDEPLALGASFDVGAWSVTAQSADLDANDVVAATNQFNEPPPIGSNFVLVALEAVNHGAEPASIVGELLIELRDAKGTAHDRFECGVIPDPLDNDEYAVGAGPVGNACFVVPVAVLDNALLEVTAYTEFNAPPVQWRLGGFPR